MTDFSYEKKKEIPKLSSNYATMMSNIEFCKDMMVLYSSFQVDSSIFSKLEEYIREEEYLKDPIFYLYKDDNDNYFYFKFISYQSYPDFILEVYSSEFFYKDTPLIYKGVSYYDIKFILRILFMKQNLDPIPMNRITYVLSGLGMSIQDFTKIVEYTKDPSICDIFKYQRIGYDLYYLIIFYDNLIHFYEFERYSQDIRRSYSNPIDYTKESLLEYLKSQE